MAESVRNRTPGSSSGTILSSRSAVQLPNMEFRLLQCHFVESGSSLPNSTFTPMCGKPPGNPNSS